VIFCILFIQNYSVFAQREADVVVPFEDEIESITLNPFTGSVIVKEKNRISSYDPESNSVEWQVLEKDLISASTTKKIMKTVDMVSTVGGGDFSQLMEAKKDEVNFISNSPFIQLTMEDVDVILNSADGSVLFNSATTGYRIMNSQYMPKEEAFLLMVINNNTYSCVFHDLASGSQKWIAELSPIDSFFKSLGSLFTSFKNGDIVSEDKVITTSDFIYASINSELYKMQKSDGKILWKSDFKITNFHLSVNQQSVITMRVAGNIFSSKMALNLLDAKSGAKLWKDDISTKYITYLEDAGDKILIAHTSGFNFYNYSDGKKVWKKDAKGKKIKQVIRIGDDYLYVADKEMNLIDRDGQNKWKKFIEICDNDDDEVYYLGKIDDEKVLYLTDSYANMVDYATGKKVWKKNIDFDKNRPLLYSYDDVKNVYLVYNDKKLYKLDPAIDGRNKPEPFAKLKKINDDKSMADIELFDWGVSLVGQNDAVGVTFDGETKYHNTYKEPGGGKRKFLKGAAGAGAGAYRFLSGAKKSISNAQTVTPLYDSKGNIVGEERQDLLTEESKARLQASAARDEKRAALINKNMAKFTERFNALKHNDEYAYIFAKNEDTDGPQLVKVRKTDGEEIDKIAIDGTKPIYEVDSYNDNVYYAHKNQLRIYNRK